MTQVVSVRKGELIPRRLRPGTPAGVRRRKKKFNKEQVYLIARDVFIEKMTMRALAEKYACSIKTIEAVTGANHPYAGDWLDAVARLILEGVECVYPRKWKSK